MTTPEPSEVQPGANSAKNTAGPDLPTRNSAEQQGGTPMVEPRPSATFTVDTSVFARVEGAFAAFDAAVKDSNDTTPGTGEFAAASHALNQARRSLADAYRALAPQFSPGVPLMFGLYHAASALEDSAEFSDRVAARHDKDGEATR